MKYTSFLRIKISNLLPGFPTQPQVAPREEARHRVAGQVVDPPLDLKLPHDGVDPRKPCLAL